MERVQPQGTTQLELEGGEVPSLAPFPPEVGPQGLEHLALTARATPGQAGREALRSLHAGLVALSPTAQNATLLVRLLDEGAFHELRADDGSLTRELAVETLLGLGYPWALQVHPEELAWYRRSRFLRTRNKVLLLLAAFAGAAWALWVLIGFA